MERSFTGDPERYIKQDSGNGRFFHRVPTVGNMACILLS